MLYKESAIAVMIAVMLGAASLIGGLASPALAIHDPDAVLVQSEQISQGEGESMTVGGVEFTAKKSSSRSSGTLTVAIVQDNEILGIDNIDSDAIGTFSTDLEASFDRVNVTGDFEILVEYLGNGLVTASNIKVVEGTETAGGEVPADDDETPDNDTDEQPQEELQNIIASANVTQSSENSRTVETVEFTAKKSSSRSSGTLTVAIVQDNEILGIDNIDSDAIGTFSTDLEASFDRVNVTGDFQVAIMHEGSGIVTARDINVLSETEPAENPDEEPTPSPTPGTAQLTVNSVNQNNEPITGMWVAVLQGMTLVESGNTEITFNLDSGATYIVEMGDYHDEASSTLYEFNGWADSVQDNRRTAVITENEEFTAKYIVTTGSAPPPVDDTDNPPTTPPPSSESGTITVFAYRIPSEHWGATFVSANAQMYFVMYNSTGDLIHTAFFDENGHTITGLNDDETYWIYPTDCEECHGDPHDVVFHHWQDNNTERPRSVTPGTSVGAYYEYIPPS